MRKGLTYYEIIFSSALLALIFLPTINGIYVAKLSLSKTSNIYNQITIANNSLTVLKNSINTPDTFDLYNDIYTLPYNEQMDLDKFSYIFSVIDFNNNTVQTFSTDENLNNNILIKNYNMSSNNDYIIVLSIYFNDNYVGEAMEIISFIGGNNV